ncbi:unnamed protein product [Kuraishia capsulata CBS 1993]|uniref:alanine--glyoxylate transaminase n=1 Tax=Kuraishia capsulata CBS 1993 TaxID=1382522 RepID=W6MTK5_9ASCO|nr:uncharacterized protein KUCA_T00004500001 [Kuraishia capsulata CBS 1993]CDK28517.1 unnamed protein product [Kuraishia capsulata CBS 1993]
MAFIDIPSSTQEAHKLTLIPGPIEFTDAVLAANAYPAQAHTGPDFVAVFQSALKNTRKLFKSTDPDAQPLVISASGTLGWEIVGSNFLTENERVLLLSTGFFSDAFADCLKVFTDRVDVLPAPLGDVVSFSKVEDALKKAVDDKEPYAVITITHVDTSSGVLMDVEKYAELVKRVSPTTLIIVDGVCSVAVETLEFDKWGLDYVLTASQKGVDVPPGLSISFASKRALEKAKTVKPRTYYSNLQKWIPIMKAYESGAGAYFATPPVQLIHALDVSLKEIVPDLDARIAKNAVVAEKLRSNLDSIGIKCLAKPGVGAHGVSGYYFPESINGPAFLKSVGARGIQLATGIYKGIKDDYFRIGHMGVSALGEGRRDLEICFEVIQEALKENGYSS